MFLTMSKNKGGCRVEDVPRFIEHSDSMMPENWGELAVNRSGLMKDSSK